MWFKRFLPWRREEHTYLKNFIFGVEDSLVSTVGLLAGVAAADVSRAAIVTTGMVLIVVEGVSMGIGSFLSEESAEEMVGQSDNDALAIRGGVIMLFSYIVAGFVPLSPYIFLDLNYAMTSSIVASLIGLFFLGLGTALYFKSGRALHRACKMTFLGGLAVAIGVVVGKLFHL
jgi:VIT1/CCC1 family predicted Fe2+/Mn2+ transporter